MGLKETLKHHFNFKEAFQDANREQKALMKGDAVRLEYLGGHPKLVEGTLFIKKGDEPNTLILRHNIGGIEYPVTVTKLEWDEQGKRSAGKAVAGVIIGGVLTGGIGALVGGAIGGRKKDNSLAVMTYISGVFEGTIYFRADNNEYQKLARLL